MMQFSGLETTTISIIGSIVTGAVVRVWMGRSFVSKEACLASREACKEVQSVDQCRVGDKIKAVEETLKGEDAEIIKTATEALMQSMQQIASKAYEKSAAAGEQTAEEPKAAKAESAKSSDASITRSSTNNA